MKHLRLFESLISLSKPKIDLQKHTEDIILVFVEYLNNYDDSYSHSIYEILDDAGVEYDGDNINFECIRSLLSELMLDWSDRTLERVLDVYHDCSDILKKSHRPIKDEILDIFNEFVDTNHPIKVYRNHDSGDRYVINIQGESILLKLNFREILGRLHDISEINLTYSGSTNYIQFTIDLLNPD